LADTLLFNVVAIPRGAAERSGSAGL